MILLLSDVHCRYDVIDRQLAHATDEAGGEISDILVLGDFGLFEPFMKRFFHKGEGRLGKPTHFIEGNHEDFVNFDRLVERYRDVITHLPRSTVHTIGGVPTLALGGVCYMDAHTTPLRAEIRPEDIDRCLALPPGSADLVISHDCPADIGVRNESGFGHYGPPGFAGTGKILDHFQPRLWVFGHHHRWFDTTIDGTRFFGLPQSWVGYALLADNGELHRIDHSLPRQRRSWFDFLRRSRQS